MRRWWVLCSVAACASPTYKSGALQCAPAEPRCPGGYHCALDGACWLTGIDPDLGAPDGSATIDWTWHGSDLASDDLCAAPKCECGTIDTGCGHFDCELPTCSSKKQICNIVYPQRCGCPPPGGRTPVVRNVSPDGTHHCLSSFGNGCEGYQADATPLFYAYTGDPIAGLLNFNVCADPSAGWTTFVGTGCGADAGSLAYANSTYFVPDGQMCDTVALHRYRVASGEFYTLNPATAPSGAVELPAVYVWPTP